MTPVGTANQRPRSRVAERIKRGWTASSAALADADAFWTRSAATLARRHVLHRVFAENVRGRVLDAGAGTLCARRLVRPYAKEYRSLDARQTHPEIDVVADIQHIPMADEQFDAVVCLEVLEHVPDPEQALRELHRVLARGGRLVLSVPHLGYLHNEPDDYFRYTRHGIRTLLERAGFVVCEVVPAGGLLSFLQHIVATVAVGLTFGVPVVWPVTRAINHAFAAAAVWIDAHTDRKKLFALDYVVVAERARAAAGSRTA